MYEVIESKIKLKNGSIKKGLLAIASGKGGVGKSTVTVNLAMALSNLGNEVGIIDADVYGFSIPRIIGLKDRVTPIKEKEMLPPAARGIKVISMGSFMGENEAIIWRSPLLMSALEQFLKDVHWGELDYLLLDLPPGTGDMALNIMQKLPHTEIIIVTTPQVTAAKVAGRIGKMAEKMEAGITGVIENMSYYLCPECGHKDYIFGQGGGRSLAEQLNTELLGQIPLITSIREGGDRGEPVETVAPDSPASVEYSGIAERIDNRNTEFNPDLKPLI